MQMQYLKEYLEILKSRPGVEISSRKSAKRSIIYYDVKQERNYGDDPWERMCHYQRNEHDGFDCDASYLTALQYAIAFPFVSCRNRELKQQAHTALKYEFVNPSDSRLFRYRGDTMNSYNTTFHELFRCFAEDKAIACGLVKAGNRWGYPEKFGCWEDYIICSQRTDVFFDMLPKSAKQFLSLVDTIGNFLPVPFLGGTKGEFNRPRGCSVAIKDYWDLTLRTIFLWYHKKDDSKLREMLGEGAGNLTLCKEWLALFGSWENFVKANYLEPFVEPRYGQPKELWTDHFITKTMPEGEQFQEFFLNAATRIEERGQLISEALMGKLDDFPDCPWKKDSVI